jgi:two-component system, OmpR family, phosphate regulon sensor histidine kinase PhoR
MRTSIRIARDGFLGGTAAWIAAHVLGSRFLEGSTVRPWIEGGAAVIVSSLAVFWRIERDVVRILDGLTRALMQPGYELRSSSEAGDLDEMHDLQLAIDRLLSGFQVRMARDTGERDRLIKILNALPVGILELDGRGRIVFQNRALMDLMDTSLRAIGRTPVEVFRSGELQELVDAVQREGVARSADLTVLEPTRLSLHVYALPVKDGLIVIVEDRTQVRRLEKARSEMVANIGHELRTPLSAILGYLETLEHSPDLSAEDRERFLSVISRNSKRLQRLVLDLSRLSRLESNQPAPRPESLDLAGLARSVVETFLPRTQEQNIQVRIDIPQGLSRVKADRDGLETVLLNLMENAVRATPLGGRVTVGAREDNDQIEVWVEDTGPGIPTELRERVFERFFRIDEGRSLAEGGSGLGLAIVKHTVLQYGGKVWIDEGAQGGARVHLSLPRWQSELVTK